MLNTTLNTNFIKEGFLMSIKPLGDRVVIKRLEAEEKRILKKGEFRNQ